MDIQEQKDIADEVLCRLEGIDPTCIIAGGAPRDWTFGRLASDLDCFFYWRNDLQVHYVIKALDHVGLPYEPRPYRDSIERQYEYVRNPHLKGVYEGELYGMKIQLMHMNAPTFKSVIPEFPLDICKVWYKNGEIRTTPEFEKAKEHKILQIKNKLYANQDAYIQKIKSKFPDFLFIG